MPEITRDAQLTLPLPFAAQRLFQRDILLRHPFIGRQNQQAALACLWIMYVQLARQAAIFTEQVSDLAIVEGKTAGYGRAGQGVSGDIFKGKWRSCHV